MLAASLNLSVVEIVVLLFGAIILGITIHFFISSRKNLRATTSGVEQNSLAKDEWKLKYFNDMELREREISNLKQRMQELEENTSILTMESEEMRRTNRLLKSEVETAKNNKTDNQQNYLNTIEELKRQNRRLEEELALASQPLQPDEMRERHHHPDDYLDQLQQAQKSLLEHNAKINQLLGNIDVIKEKEEMHQEMLRTNEELTDQISYMREALQDKEKEMDAIRQKEHLTHEMTSMLDHAYNDFNVLQDKLHKLESDLMSSKMVSLELEDTREAHNKLLRDYEQQKQRNAAMLMEMQDLRNRLQETEEDFRDTSFQKQQLQKRVAHLEELNNDLQMMTDANKKLEGQLRRIGELESMLNVVSEERDQLRSKHG